MSPIDNTLRKIVLYTSCRNKRKYREFQDAVRVLLGPRQMDDWSLHIYRCIFGSHWHLGHDRSNTHLKGPMLWENEEREK